MDIKERKNYIGGSDCAAVLGVSKWHTPAQVWAEKTGLIEHEDISDKLSVKLGHKLEETVAQLFTEQTGKKVHRVNETITHPHYDFIRANIDRKVEGEDSILECKTTGGRNAKLWEGDDMPPEYILQCMHYLAVTGKKKAYLAVLIGGNEDFRIKEIHRDEELIKSIVENEVKFWNEFVIPKVMPIVTARDGDLLYKLFPQAQPEVIVPLPDKYNAIKESIDALKQDKAVIDKQIKQLENEFKAAIKDGEVGETGLWRISWKNIAKAEYMCPAQSYRQLFYKQIKQEA